MIIREISPISVSTKLVEPEVNRSATNWLMKNREKMVKHVMSLGIIDKAEDLISDVYLSIFQAENDGDGFDINYGTGASMTVETFVIGRINRYAKSKKYRSGVVSSVKYKVNSNEVELEAKVDNNGTLLRDKNGRVVYNRKTVCKKENIEYVAYAVDPVSCSSDNMSDNSLQYKYNNAMSESASRELEMVDDELSVESSLGICIDIADKYNINIINIFRNIDYIAEILEGVKIRREEAVDIFHELRRVAVENDEFESAFIDVLNYSATNKERFRYIVNNI